VWRRRAAGGTGRGCPGLVPPAGFIAACCADAPLWSISWLPARRMPPPQVYGVHLGALGRCGRAPRCALPGCLGLLSCRCCKARGVCARAASCGLGAAGCTLMLIAACLWCTLWHTVPGLILFKATAHSPRAPPFIDHCAAVQPGSSLP